VARIEYLLELKLREFNSCGDNRARGILPKVSWVKISQIRTLSVERIGKRIGRTSPEELAQVVEGLNEIIGT
jgi:mRNA-degrading endonuclease toxin of MazEF toxin-antitoxin module